LLLDFKNGVTLELAKTVQDLDFLADRLVHIFLADNVAVDWLMYLANEEITAQFTQLKAQVSVAIDAAELQSEDAEAHQQQTLKQEATRTLFRGNSLLTKSLMKFMEKVGKDYLEETLGPYLRYVVATSAMESCEVWTVNITNLIEG
jgi:GTPase-activator protein for Ras-like GTPase